MTRARTTYRLLWPLRGGTATESVESPEEAVRCIRRWERRLSRPLENTEYDLGEVRDNGEVSVMQLWEGPGGQSIHAEVELARRRGCVAKIQ